MKTNVRTLVNKLLRDNPEKTYSVAEIANAVDRSETQVMKVLRYDVDTVAPQFNLDPKVHKIDDRKYGYKEPIIVTQLKEQNELLVAIEAQREVESGADLKRSEAEIGSRELQERMRLHLMKTSQQLLESNSR